MNECMRKFLHWYFHIRRTPQPKWLPRGPIGLVVRVLTLAVLAVACYELFVHRLSPQTKAFFIAGLTNPFILLSFFCIYLRNLEISYFHYAASEVEAASPYAIQINSRLIVSNYRRRFGDDILYKVYSRLQIAFVGSFIVGAILLARHMSHIK
jgi:hypothetical protein